MRTSLVFAVGVLVGSVVVPGLAQGDRMMIPNGLTHVGISVENFDEALAHYTKKIGLPVAFEIREPNGDPVLAYLRVSPTMFVELLPANADRKPGIDHFGVETADIKSTVALMKQRQVTVDEPRVGRTKAVIAFATDAKGVKMEVGQFGPDAMQRQAAK